MKPQLAACRSPTTHSIKAVRKPRCQHAVSSYWVPSTNVLSIPNQHTFKRNWVVFPILVSCNITPSRPPLIAQPVSNRSGFSHPFARHHHSLHLHYLISLTLTADANLAAYCTSFATGNAHPWFHGPRYESTSIPPIMAIASLASGG